MTETVVVDCPRAAGYWIGYLSHYSVAVVYPAVATPPLFLSCSPYKLPIPNIYMRQTSS